MVDVSKPYNQGVSPLTLNRILLILGVLGLFVAGVLSVEHLFELQIPCTSGGGCQTVARHSSSYIFNIPVAYFGFAGYFLLTGLALVRLFTGSLLSRLFVGLGYVGAAIGLVASLYLQYISFTQIHAICAWCLTSAIDMVFTFVFYTILFGKVGTIEETPVRSTKALYQGLVLVFIAMVGVSVVAYTSKTETGPKEVLDQSVEKSLVPEPKSARNQLGPDDAPVTVVEFADLCCPTCRKSFPKLHELIAKYPGKIRVIYRHFPIDSLKGHEMADVVAVTAEVAAQKGKFWDFAAAFTAPEEPPTTREGVDDIARTVGVSSEEITKAIQDQKSQAQSNLLRDYSDAIGVFHVEGTPTYILSVKGQPIQKLTLVGLLNELDKPEAQKLLK